MKKSVENKDIISPKKQLNLFGYEIYFNSLIKLSNENEMPNCMLISGQKGIGKSTFCYHFINYLFSSNEKKKYHVENFCINEDNLSFIQINNNTHPNFFLVENNPLEKETKIEQIRSLLKFLNQSTYSKDLKIVMIDNVENLNLNSSNALLKAIEEPKYNTFFFIVYNNSCKILDTIKSRCNEFKIFFNTEKKEKIFENLIKQYDYTIDFDIIKNYLYYDSPGNIIKYLLTFRSKNLEINSDNLSKALFLIDEYNNEKNLDTLFFASFFIEKFYVDLCFNNKKNLTSYFFNYTNIINQIHNMKKFNLYEKNIFSQIKNTLINEKR